MLRRHVSRFSSSAEVEVAGSEEDVRPYFIQSYFRAMEFKSIRIVLVVLGECEVDKKGRTEIEDRNVRLLLYY